MISILLVLIQSAEKNDPNLVRQILSLAGQLCVQMPMKCLSSSTNRELLFKSLKPLISYLHELSLTSDAILAKQATVILLALAVAKGSLQDILPLLYPLVFNTTDVYPAQGLCLQLNNGLAETLKTRETTSTSLDYLTSTRTYPSSELAHLNVQSFTGQFLSSILLAHIDIEHQINEEQHSDSMSFAFHPLTFQQLFSIIERLSTEVSPTTNCILSICLRLFRSHLQSLSTASSRLDKDVGAPIDVAPYASADQIQQWFALLLKLASDERLCLEASQALISVINLQVPSFVDKLLFLHQYIVDDTRPMVMEQCLMELKTNETLLQWIEFLCDDEQKISSVASDVMNSLLDLYFQPSASTDEQKEKKHLEEILLRFQQLLLCRLLTECGKKKIDTDEAQLSFDEQHAASTSALVVRYVARLFANSSQPLAIESDLFHSMFLGLMLITEGHEVFHYEPVQSILIAVLPLLVDHFLRLVHGSSSSTTSETQLVCWLLGRMSHVLIIGSPVDLVESKQSAKLKLSIFSGGCESVLTDRSAYLKSLLDSNLTPFSLVDETADRSLDRQFLLSIYHQQGEGGELLAKLKRYHKGKASQLQKSIEQLGNAACGQALAVYVKHYRRVNLAKHELTRSAESPPHPQLLSIYDYSTRVFSLFATIKGQGGDCEKLAEQIEKTALFLLLSVRESSLIPIIEQTMPSLVVVVVPPAGRFLRQRSRWSKAKHVIKLLRHLLQACIRFKRFMLEKRQSIKQIYDDESLVNRTMETFLFGDLSKIGTMINNEEKIVELQELEKCLVRQHERAITRLFTFRLIKVFIEKILLVTGKEHLPLILSSLRGNESDWSYLDGISTANEQIKEQISETFYSLIKSVLNEENNERILFYLLNFPHQLIDFSHLIHHQFLEIFYTKYLRYVEESPSIELKLIAFHWFRLFVFELAEHLELEHLRGTSQPILQEQQKRIFQRFILDQLKLFGEIKAQLSSESAEKETMKEMALGWLIRAVKEKQALITSQTDLDLYVDQYLVLLLRCLHLYPHVIQLCTTLDYLQTLLHLYRQSHSIVTLILLVKIFRYLLPSLDAEIHRSTMIEEFFRDLLLAIGESRRHSSAEIALDITPELISLYRTLISVESPCQGLATQFVFDAIHSSLNPLSIERNNVREINQLFASLCVLGGDIEPYRIGSIVKRISEDDEMQLALIVDSAQEISIQYLQKNTVESVTMDQLQLETNVPPPNLQGVLNNHQSEAMIDTLGDFIGLDTSGNTSSFLRLRLLSLQRRAMAVLSHLLSTKTFIERFMTKPYAPLLAQLSLAETFEARLRQPSDLRVFDKSHLEQYSLSLDRCERKKEMVEETIVTSSNSIVDEQRGMTNERDPSVIDALSSWEYHRWKPVMFEAEVRDYRKGRTGSSSSLSLVSMPRGISTAAVFEECGEKHKFRGRIVPDNENTTSSFPTYIVDDLRLSEGKWYFCVRLSVGGVVQIGWATDGFSPGGSRGVGDDAFSWSYDGSRAVLFNDGSYYGVFDDVTWSENDVCGCGIDIDGDQTNIKYWLNGKLLGKAFAHQRPIQSSHSKCNLLPHGPGTTFFPAVTIQRNSDSPRSCELIFSPEDMKECPLPRGYRPFLSPRIAPSSPSIVEYPFSAYLIGDHPEDYFDTTRTKPTELLLRDFIHEQHLETTFTVEGQRLVLPETSPGFPLSFDSSSSFTISFDFQLSTKENHLDFRLCQLDLPESIAIPGRWQEGHVAIIVHLQEQRIQVYSKEHGQLFDTQYVNRAFKQLKMHLLPNIAASLRDLAVWKYALSEDELRRLFTYGLFFISNEYRQTKTYREQAKTITFAADQQAFLDGSFVPLDQPFNEELWETKKKQANENERDYFRPIENSSASAVELRGTNTYLVLEKSAETWSSYLLILDISIPHYPTSKERLTLIHLNDQCALYLTDEGQLQLEVTEKNHESKSTVVLNEYFRLSIRVFEKKIEIFVNKTLEIEVKVTDEQLEINSKHIQLFEQKNSTNDESLGNDDKVRLSLKSLTYFNRTLSQASLTKIIESPSVSLDQTVRLPLSISGPNLIAMGYKKSWIEKIGTLNPIVHIPTIHSLLREQTEQLMEKDRQDEERRYLKVLSRLDPTTDHDQFKAWLHSSTRKTNHQHIADLAQHLFTHWIHSPRSPAKIEKDVAKDSDWFGEMVSDLGITTKFTEWTRDRGNVTADEDSIYQLLDLTPPHPSPSSKSTQYSHTSLSPTEFLQSRLACEHGLITVYARSTILQMLKVWSSNSNSNGGERRFPLESFADHPFLIRLIKLLNTKNDSPMHSLLQMLISEEMKRLIDSPSTLNEESQAPFFYHLQKEIITHAVEYLFQSTFGQTNESSSSSFQFTFEILDLYLKQLRSHQSTLTRVQLDSMVSLFFPRPLISLLFDLFLLTSTYRERLFILHLFTDLTQISRDPLLTRPQQRFFHRLLSELVSNKAWSSNRSRKQLQVGVTDLIFALRNKVTNKEDKLPEPIDQLFTTIEVISQSTSPTKPPTASVSEAFLRYLKKLGGGGQVSFTGEELEKSNEHFTSPTIDQELIQLMNSSPLCDESFTAFLASLPTADSPTNSTFYKNHLSLSSIPPESVHIRARYLYLFSQAIKESLAMIDFTLPVERSLLTDHVRQAKIYLLHSAKSQLFDHSLEQTEGSYSDAPSVNFDTVQASTDQQSSESTMFSQACQQLHPTAHTLFRSSNDQLWRAQYLGMHSTDQGGPYRDSITRICTEICSTRLSLFILSPNGRTNSGSNRDCWIPNVFHPHRPIPKKFKKQYRFLGQLMGMAIRKKHYLHLKLAPLVWKGLLGEELTVKDIEAIDEQSFTMIYELEKNVEQILSPSAETEDNVGFLFSSILSELQFDVVSSAGQTFELMPGGAKIPITMENCKRYCTNYRHYRLKEFHRQIDLIRQGLHTVIPRYYLSLFTALELEEAVCGKAQLDLELLKRNTYYGGDYTANTPHIQHFWTVFCDMFDEEQRKLFLTFVWGRNTLPRRDDEFQSKFVIATYDVSEVGENIDRALPRSHTCFFTIDLPEYSTADIMYERLNYAITCCSSIDADGMINELPDQMIGFDADDDDDD